MDDLESKVAAGLVTEIFKSILSGAKWGGSRLADRAKALDILGKSAARYRAGMLERHGSMRILGMSKPVPLKDIYTRVNVLKSITSRRYEDIASLRVRL